MTITKGILTKKHELKPSNLVTALLIWILTAYIFYAFFQVYREVFRIFTGQLGPSLLLVLSPEENYIYNLFYASIASALGYLIALRFILQNSWNGHNWPTKSLIRRTLNTEGFYTWSFLFWFGKLGSMLGVGYMITGLQYDLDLIEDFPVMLMLLPLVLFYSVWPNITRLIRGKKIWWWLRLTGIFLVMSFGFAFKNFTDYEKINKYFLSQSFKHVFDLKIPVSQSHERIPRGFPPLDIYIVRDTIDTREPVVFFEKINYRVDIEDIRKAVTLEKQKFYEQARLIANLHIDKRITMDRIKPILNELRKADLRNIQFSTGRKYSRYPADYPAFKYSGIQKELLPKYYPEFEQFPDSASQIDLKDKAFKLSKSLMYRNGVQNNYNRIEIHLTPDAVTLNQHKIDSLALESKIYGFIKKYSPNYVIIFNSDGEVTYKRYIRFLDILWTQVDRLRDELSIARYNQPYAYWYRGAEQDTIKRRFPRNFIEWSPEEQSL